LGLFLTIAGICSITILSLVTFLDYYGGPANGMGMYRGPVMSPSYIALIYVTMFAIFFSLPITAEIEAYLWLRKGKLSKTTYLAFIAYSVCLAIVIIYDINEKLLHIWYTLLISSVLEFQPWFPSPKSEVNRIFILASLIFMLGLLIICIYLLIKWKRRFIQYGLENRKDRKSEAKENERGNRRQG